MTTLNNYFYVFQAILMDARHESTILIAAVFLLAGLAV